MPPRENQKAVAAKERKAATKAEKDAKKAQEDEVRVVEEWSKGAKSSAKKDTEQARREEALAKKAEREALLKAEEEGLGAKPARPARGDEKKAVKRQTNLDSALSQLGSEAAEEFAASGIDSALDLMAALDVTPGSPAGSAALERHPERRVKSAYAAFEEDELPKLKAENPTLRQSQLKQLLAKKWKKSPRNPMNQATIAHNATAEEEREALGSLKSQVLESMKVER
ncbi:hypothetical protein DFJ74DRAFT_685230 [Hyaloraphidium curvatum]|nr:hypothetical protein DFJ74DRAFT_685230 [Hyaloraphidium curvatum]